MSKENNLCSTQMIRARLVTGSGGASPSSRTSSELFRTSQGMLKISGGVRKLQSNWIRSTGQRLGTAKLKNKLLQMHSVKVTSL